MQWQALVETVHLPCQAARYPGHLTVGTRHEQWRLELYHLEELKHELDAEEQHEHSSHSPGQWGAPLLKRPVVGPPYVAQSLPHQVVDRAR